MASDICRLTEILSRLHLVWNARLLHRNVLVPFVWKGTGTWWLLGLAIVFLVAVLVIPSWLVPIEKGWMRFAAVLGSINSRILLTVVFIVIVVPIRGPTDLRQIAD